jgi:formylglycine-generating enzyme required for sulfatase activity
MLGNVWEWADAWYGQYTAGPVRDPKGPANGDTRVLRGGSWGNRPGVVRVSSRYLYRPEGRVDVIGFRCVRESLNP